MTGRTRGPLAAAAIFLGALVLAFSLAPSSEAPFVRLAPGLPPEPGLLVLLLALLPASARRAAFSSRSGNIVGVLVGVVLLTAALARFAGLGATGWLGRPLDPAGDLPHLGRVAEMLGSGAATSFGVAFAVLLVALGLVGAAAGTKALARLLGASSTRARAVAATVAAAACVPALWPPGSPGSAEAVRIVLGLSGGAPVDLPEPPLAAAPDLGGADLYVLFVESYGVAAFTDPGRRARLLPAYRRLAEDAEAAGFGFLSSQIQSPTFGGGSWRAHASFLSGTWVDGEARYRALLDSDRPSLAGLLAERGYRTAAFEPGIRGRWPDGGWYGFDRIFDRDGLGYDGPPIGWWVVPDQFTLHALGRHARREDAPLFAKVSLITSHIPYRPVPPYVEDWSRFDDGTAYEAGLRSVAHDDFRDLVELGGYYVEALSYVLRVAGGFLRRRVPRPALVVLIGDHQPPRLALHDGDSWATPIHLFSRDESLLAPFRELGFAETLLPERGTAWRMSDFPRDLARLFPGRS